MLKWEVYGQEDEPVRLPNILNWLSIIVITGAFSFVVYLWYRWLTLLAQHNQSLLFWLQS